MQKFIFLSASLLGALSVIIGAFGAHALKASLELSQKLETFETAVKYQFYHTLALLLIGLILYRIDHRWISYAGIFMIIGILIFSGSLYILCLTNSPRWGMVTPIGGAILIAGWLSLFWGIWKGY